MVDSTKLTIGQLNEAIAGPAHKDLAYSTDQDAVSRWRNLACSMVEGADFWWWLRNPTVSAITLVADTYAYSLAADFSRLDGASLYYANSPTARLVCVEDPAVMDRELGPVGFDDGGSPSMCAVVGDKLWTRLKPNATFVADNPTLYYLYFRTILPTYLWEAAKTAANDATETRAPTWTLPYLVSASMAFSLQEEDDNAFQAKVRDWYANDLVQMRTFTQSPSSYEPPLPPLIRQRSRRGWRGSGRY